MANFGSSVFFRLTVGGDDLGAFHTCAGLGARVEVEQFQEGGNNGFVWQLPSRITWTNITISPSLRATRRIVALEPNLTPIARWQVLGIVPVNWQGPSFDPGRSEAAVETLEIAHQGLRAS